MAEPSEPTSRGLEALIPGSKKFDDQETNPFEKQARPKDIEILVEDQGSRLKAAKDIIKEQHSQIQSLQNKLHKLHMESL